MIRFLLIAAILLGLFLLWRSSVRPRPQMSVQEAAKLLGVAEDAAPEAINEAHKRLIAKVHPDAGGSAELAARVNLARDTLLGKAVR